MSKHNIPATQEKTEQSFTFTWQEETPTIPALQPQPGITWNRNFMVVLHTNFGDIKLDLNTEKAPATVANFLEYVKSGHFDGTIFHRVINGFMIQGGGFEPGMNQKDTQNPITNEANNGLKNTMGTIAMARTMDPHSATAQFFINVSDNNFLNHTSETPDGWGYAVFGKVSEGMDVIEKIRAAKTTFRAGHQDVPLEDIIIESAELV